MCCGMGYRVIQRGSHWGWEILSTDHVVLACGEEASALQARDRAMRELLKLHESFHQKGARARLGLGRVKPHH